jgi:hypothetical protein
MDLSTSYRTFTPNITILPEWRKAMTKDPYCETRRKIRNFGAWIGLIVKALRY